MFDLTRYIQLNFSSRLQIFSSEWFIINNKCFGVVSIEITWIMQRKYKVCVYLEYHCMKQTKNLFRLTLFNDSLWNETEFRERKEKNQFRKTFKSMANRLSPSHIHAQCKFQPELLSFSLFIVLFAISGDPRCSKHLNTILIDFDNF